MKTSPKLILAALSALALPALGWANPTPVYLLDAGSTATDGWTQVNKNGSYPAFLQTDTTYGAVYMTSTSAGNFFNTYGVPTKGFESGMYVGLNGTEYTSVLEEMAATLGLTSVPDTILDNMVNGGFAGHTITVSGLDASKTYVMYYIGGANKDNQAVAGFALKSGTYAGSPKVEYVCTSADQNTSTVTSYTAASSATIAMRAAKDGYLLVRVSYIKPAAAGTIQFTLSGERSNICALAIAEIDPLVFATHNRSIDSADETWNTVSEWTDSTLPADVDTVNLTAAAEGATLAIDTAATVNQLTIGGDYALTLTGSETLNANTTVINTDTDASAIKANLGAVTIEKDVKLTIGSDTSWTSISGDGVICLNGTELKISSDLTANIEIGDSGATITADSGHIAITGAISGSGALTLNGGTGSLAIMNANNTYDGEATIASGAVYLGNYGNQSSGTASVFPAKTVTVKNGASLISHVTGTCTWSFDITLEDGATLGIKDAIGIANGSVTFAGDLAINGNANFPFHWCKGADFTGVISGTGTLTVTGNTAEGGTSTLKLSNAANTFTGTYKLASTSNAVKLIVAEGAATTASISLDAANDSIEFSAEKDTIAGITGTDGTVTTSLDVTELTVTGTADVEKLTLDKVTIPGVSGGEGGGEDPEEPTGPVCGNGVDKTYTSIADAIADNCTYIMMTAATTEDVTLPEGYSINTYGATITGKVTIQKGATLHVLWGGAIVGDLTFEDGAYLNVNSGELSVSGAVNFPTEGTFNLTMNTIPAMGEKLPFITLGTALKDDDVTIGTLKFIVGKEEYTTGYKVVTTESTKSYDVTTTATPSCELDGTAYGSFEEAITAASAGDYAGDRKLVLTSAASLASALTIDLGGDDKVLTIDLADNTISCWNPTVTPLITIQRGTVKLETSSATVATGNMITSAGVTVVVGTETPANPTLIIGKDVTVATYAYGDAVSVVKGTIGGAGSVATQGADTALTMAAGTTLDITQGALTLQNDALLGLPETGTVNVTVADGAKAGDVILTCDTNGITADKFVVSNESLGVTVGAGQITLVDVTTEEDDPVKAALIAALGEEAAAAVTSVTNPEVAAAINGIITGSGTVELDGTTAKFTYDFKVTDIFFDEEGNVSVTVSVGENQTFTSNAMVSLTTLDGDEVMPESSRKNEDGTITSTFVISEGEGTLLFKAKADQTNEESSEEE